jgi:2,3-dimethylmalate lyase
MPKRCGHFDGNSLISEREMVQKLHAALDARVNADTVIIARTDAYQSEGMGGAVSRANAYADAGADVIFVEAPTSLDDLLQLPTLIDKPLMANMVEGGKTPLKTAAELQEIGYRIALFANTALRASIRAAQLAMAALHRDGSSNNILDRIATWDQRQKLVRLPDYTALEDRFLGPQQ